MYSAKNVLRKEEHDWKMVYLARTEETDQAIIEWKVDVSTRKLAIKDVQLRCDTKVYESGRIAWEYVLNTGKSLGLTSFYCRSKLNSFNLNIFRGGGQGLGKGETQRWDDHSSDTDRGQGGQCVATHATISPGDEVHRVPF